MTVTRLLLRTRAAAHIAAVVPAYNVARELPEVLRAMPALFTTVIVIDDASIDDTAAVAEHYAEIDPRIVVLRHEKIQGVGGAMVTGFKHAIDAGADIVVKIDGDGQMPLCLVPALVEALKPEEET